MAADKSPSSFYLSGLLFGDVGTSKLVDASSASRPSLLVLDDEPSVAGQPDGHPAAAVEETTASRLNGSSDSPSAISYSLSSGDLAGIIVAATVVTVALVVIAVWLHLRHRKSKSAALNADVNAGSGNRHHSVIRPMSSVPPPPLPISVISMETDVKRPATRQNSVGYLGPMSGGDMNGDEEVGSYTDYGSVIDSFPPSPTLSFRSALDLPGGSGFSRSRSGTGTSFGTVASFSSHKSVLSNTASFHTCLEEEFP